MLWPFDAKNKVLTKPTYPKPIIVIFITNILTFFSKEKATF